MITDDELAARGRALRALLDDEDAAPEVRLWRQVIARALDDAVGFVVAANKPSHRQRIRDEAREWLECDPAFLEVADLAEIDGEGWRERMTDVLAAWEAECRRYSRGRRESRRRESPPHPRNRSFLCLSAV